MTKVAMAIQAARPRARRSAGRERAPQDTWLVASVFALLALGVVMVYSASISAAGRATGASDYFVVRHVLHLSAGLVAMFIVMHTRVRYWQAASTYLLLAGIVLLVLVLVPGLGVHVNGSTRWIRLGFVSLQPAEFVKLFMVVYVSSYLVRKQEQLRQFVPGIVMMSLVVAVVGMLLLQQPDLGTVVVICVTVMTMLFLGGVRFWHFAIVVAAGIGGMVALTLASPYRLERVTGFLNPWADPFDSGFQLVQALIAFGRGELFGVGLGASVQKLFYLPAAHTDFLLAVLGEELGLVGVTAVIVLFGILVVRAFAIARRAEEEGEIFAARLAQGVATLLGTQAVINMGVNMGVLPTKGLTLPLMSYGGSSIVANCVAVGLLFMIEREARRGDWGRC